MLVNRGANRPQLWSIPWCAELSFDILIVVAVTTFIQSLFGVGVLLYGTPLLLLLGYNFIHVIIILLPISISINLCQIAKDHNQIDFSFRNGSRYIDGLNKELFREFTVGISVGDVWFLRRRAKQ